MATDMTMKWTEKLIKHSFKEIMLAPNKEGVYKKKLIGINKNWSGLTESNINPDHKAVAVLTGIKSGILVIDFDDKNLYTETIEEFPELSLAPRVETRNGYHLYFLWKDDYQKDLPAKIGKIDILKNGQQAIFPGTTYITETNETLEYKWDNKGDIFDLPSDFISKYSKNKIDNDNVNDNLESDISLPSQSVSKENKCIYLSLIAIIKVKFIDDYSSWFHLLCAMYNLGKINSNLDLYKSEAIKMSKRSKKYDYNIFEKTWNSCAVYNYTPGSIRYYARLSDHKEYSEICLNVAGKDSDFYVYNEIALTKYVLQVAGDSIVLNKGKMYVYNRDHWQEETRDGCLTQALIEVEIFNLYDKILLPKLYSSGEKTDDAELRKKIGVQILTVLKTKTNLKIANFASIYRGIRNKLTVDDPKCEIFDTDPYVFAWKNTCYNLKTNEFFKPQKFDYILCTNNLDYHEPTNPEMETVKYIFESIFPDPEMRKAYISILKSGLSAVRVEKFIVCTGEGRNGKGVLNDLFSVLLGNYFSNLALTVLTKPIKEGPNTELRCIDKKRFLKATEPDSGCNEKLRMSNIKALTGENTMKARECYEGNYDITISATIILECNTKPYIITDGNEAERQRLLIIPFGVCFTDNEEDILREPDKYKPKNDTFKTSEFKEQHASALFRYIINSVSGTNNDPCPLYIPEKCVQLALQWIQDKDAICSWFFDAFELDSGSVIKVSDVFKMYRDSDYISRDDKKNMKLKDFTEMVSKKLKGIYMEAKKYYRGTRLTANSITGYKIKTDGECSYSIVDDPE